MKSSMPRPADPRRSGNPASGGSSRLPRGRAVPGCLLFLVAVALLATAGSARAALVHRWSFDDGTANDSVGTAHGTLYNGATISGGQLHLDGVNDYVRTSPLPETLGARTLMVWVTLSNLTQRAGSALTLENPTDDDTFDGIIFGEQEARRWINGSEYALRWNTSAGTLASPEETSLGQVWIAIVYGDPTRSSDNIRIYRNGVLYADYTPPNPRIAYPAGVADVLIGVRHSDLAGGTGTADGFDEFLAGSIDEARLYDTALTADQIGGGGGASEPAVTTLAANPVSAAGGGITNATLRAGVRAGGNQAHVHFEWGTHQLYGQRTPTITLSPASVDVAVTHPLTGLAAGVAYHYRVVSSNDQGVVYRGADRVFGAPVVTLNGLATLIRECPGGFNDAGVQVTDPTSTIAIGAGNTFSVALHGDGSVVAWGFNGFTGSGRTTVPAGLNDVVSLAAGSTHSLALRSDGIVASWGENSSGQTNVPAGLSNVVAVAGGDAHSLALRSDGTVVAWGLNTSGQANVPAGLSHVVAIDAGYYHSLALRSDGTVAAWGRNTSGQASVPAGLNNVVAIAAGGSQSLALRSDGRVVAWGASFAGQTTVPVGLSNVVAMAAGDGYSLALRGDGTVAAWGDNYYGQTNVPVSLTNVVAIAAGSAHSLALRRDGTIVGWGQNLIGEASPPPSSPGVTAVVAGRYHNLALRGDGKVSAWGAGTTQTGVAPEFGQARVPSDFEGVTALAAGETHSVALRSNGTVVAWGNNTSGQTNVPPGLNGVITVSAGSVHTLTLKGDGTMVAWGVHGGGFDFGQATVPTGLGGVVAIAAGPYHNLALQSDGTVFAWGRWEEGQTAVPAGLNGVVAVFAGFHYSLALKSDGTVVGWGLDDFGQASPPAGLSGVVALAPGFDHTLALKSDGTVVGWGNDADGKATVPSGLADVVGIAAGWDHSAAVKRNGTVVAWGSNQYGQTTVPKALATATFDLVVTDNLNLAVPGHYTRTYTATTRLGGVNRATRTLVLPGGLPVVNTLAATGAGPTRVTLQARVNPRNYPTDVWFEWGSSSNYGATTSRRAIGTGMAEVPVGEALTGLTVQGQPFHYRAVAQNCGGTVYGEDRVFVLPEYPTPGLASAPANQTIPQGATSALIALTLVNGNNVTAISSNPALVPNAPANLSLSGTGSNRTLRVVPVPGQSGETLITVTVNDGEQSTSRSFLVTVPPGPEDFSSLLITRLEVAQPETLRMRFTDGGAGVTDLNLDYRPMLAADWTTPSATFLDLGGGNYEASITGMTNDTGFFRVRAVRLMTAQLGADGLSVDGVPGTSLLSLTFTAPMQGWVTYSVGQLGRPTTTNTVYVNGTTALLSVPVGPNPEPGTLRNFTVTLLDTTAGRIVGGSQTSFSVEDSANEWQGTFGSGEALFGFVMKLQNDNGRITSGTLYSAAYGVFPTNGHPVSITYWSNYFSATALDVPVSASGTLLNEPVLLSLTLMATNGPPGQSVTPDAATGPASLVLRTPNFPALETTNHGSFVLLKAPPRASTNQATLVTAP